jgi:hypothetical protein
MSFSISAIHPRAFLTLALAPAARSSFHDGLPACLGTFAAALALALAPATRPFYPDILPARLGTRLGALRHPRCPSRGAA